MATGSIARLIGSVTGGHSPALLPSHTEGLGWDELTGTVSRALIESWESPALFFRYRVKLGGEWVDEDELVGALTLDRKDIDSHTSAATFSLQGIAWSIWRTTKVWALTEVEVYIDHGVAGSVIEPATPDWVGFVIGCDQGGEHEPSVTVRCGGISAPYERYDSCEEVAPLSELTRGEILTLLFDAAGATISSPSGAVYNKPLQAANKRLFSVVTPFIEPEGWRLREMPDGTFETWVPELKRPPLPPDWAWTKGDVVSIAAIPPEAVPSRWVVTGSTVLLTDELGVTTELTVTEVIAEYAPIVATQVRAADGTLSSSGYSPLPAATRVVMRIEDEVSKRGQEVIQQRTREYGWYNPKRGRLITRGDNLGDPGDGYDYVTGFVTPDGEDVRYHIEKFGLIGERVTDFGYDVSGTLLTQNVQTFKYTLRRRAVRAATTPIGETDHVGSYVFSDDQSYATKHEEYGIHEAHYITFTYNETEGALMETEQNTYRWYRPRARVDGGSGDILYDGTGQTDVEAIWSLVETLTTNDLIRDGQKVGQTEVTYAYSVIKRIGGAFDWGDFSADAEFETFRFVGSEAKQFNVVSEEQIEQVTYPPEGGRESVLILGRRPITRYTGSTWTRIVSEPFEEVIDDPTVEAWFGFARETITSEYIQNSAEAIRVLSMRRNRMLSKKLQVQRPDSPAAKGDTVHFSSPEDGINARFIITDKQHTIGNDGRMPMATYRLEEWL